MIVYRAVEDTVGASQVIITDGGQKGLTEREDVGRETGREKSLAGNRQIPGAAGRGVRVVSRPARETAGQQIPNLHLLLLPHHLVLAGTGSGTGIEREESLDRQRTDTSQWRDLTERGDRKGRKSGRGKGRGREREKGRRRENERRERDRKKNGGWRRDGGLRRGG